MSPIRECSLPTDATTRLTCQLRRKTTGRAAHSPVAGEIEITNVSPHTIEIPIATLPLQYLHLLVEEEQGQVVSDGHYGDLFSPQSRPSTFRLAPGETYVSPVSLLATVPPERLRPGVYLIRAVFEYADLCAVSAPYRLEWPAREG